jgi:hypothetical protein
VHFVGIWHLAPGKGRVQGQGRGGGQGQQPDYCPVDEGRAGRSETSPGFGTLIRSGYMQKRGTSEVERKCH